MGRGVSYISHDLGKKMLVNEDWRGIVYPKGKGRGRNFPLHYEEKDNRFL